tara:strand:- start:1965 stop:2381 length:417 start_codon:yes stop_codon:yes gene_type:complete
MIEEILSGIWQAYKTGECPSSVKDVRLVDPRYVEAGKAFIALQYDGEILRFEGLLASEAEVFMEEAYVKGISYVKGECLPNGKASIKFERRNSAMYESRELRFQLDEGDIIIEVPNRIIDRNGMTSGLKNTLSRTFIL